MREHPVGGDGGLSECDGRKIYSVGALRLPSAPSPTEALAQ